MKCKSAIAVMFALFMVFSAIPMSESVADRPDAVLNGFVFKATPTQETFDEYLFTEEYVGANLIYALGLYNGCFDYNITLKDITYDKSGYYQNYYFDTDETGVEQYLTDTINMFMSVKVVATVKDYYGGYDLFLRNLVGDVSTVKEYIGSTFAAGDTITIDARLSISEYNGYNETDMLRTDGQYIKDSWDNYFGYLMKSSGTAVFSVNGRTTETVFDTYDAEAMTSICNWRYSTDISDVKLGDSFDYDRNNRLLYNSHFCNYKLGNGIYTISDTDSTSSSYMDMKSVVDEYDFYTSAEINDPEYIYYMLFGFSSSDLVKIGTLDKNVSNAIFKVTTDKVNLIDELSVDFYNQKDIDSLNSTINKLNKTNEDLTKSNVELSKENEKLIKSNDDLSEANENLIKSNGSLVKANEDLTKSNKDLKKTNEDLTKSNDDLRNTVNDLNKKADQNKTILFILILAIAVLVAILIAVAVWKGSAKRNV